MMTLHGVPHADPQRPKECAGRVWLWLQGTAVYSETTHRNPLKMKTVAEQDRMGRDDLFAIFTYL